LFILKHKREVASVVARGDHLFNLDDGDVFHFDASFYVKDMTTVGLYDYKYRGLCSEEVWSGESGKKTLVVGKDWGLVRDYSIRAVMVDLEGNRAEFVLNKEGEMVDKRNISSGGWFSLNDGVNFHFDATVDAIFRGTDTNIVQLTPFILEWWMAVGEPHDLQASAGDGYVDLAWDVPDTDCGSPIKEYKIYRGISSGDESYLASVYTPEISYKDTAVTNGQTYHYYVTAVNDDGESSPSSEASAKPHGPPSPPQNFQAAAGDGYVGMSWDEPDDGGGVAIRNYNIYRGTTPGGEKFANDVGNVLTYTDSDVINGQTYYYQVSAVNAADEGARSEEVEVILIPNITPPSSPQKLTSSPGDRKVKLGWDMPLDDGGTPVTRYKVYRSNTPGGEKTLLTTVGNMLTYTDKNVNNDQTYYYQVSAVNSAGEEGIKSNGVEATPKKEYDLAVIAALIAAAATIAAVIISPRKRQYGSISATSSPDGVKVLLDGGIRANLQ